MKTTLAVLMGFVILTGATVRLVAHHSFAAEFDVKQPVLFKGDRYQDGVDQPARLDPHERDAAEWQDRSVDGRRRRAHGPLSPRFQQNLAAGGYADRRRWLSREGRDEQDERPRNYVRRRSETVRRLRGHRRTAITESALPDRGFRYLPDGGVFLGRSRDGRTVSFRRQRVAELGVEPHDAVDRAYRRGIGPAAVLPEPVFGTAAMT